MGGGMVIGTAPGYKVSGVKFACKPGGAGQECTARGHALRRKSVTQQPRRFSKAASGTPSCW